ncbi:unnamed protein product [Nezara viridula]|uniref:Uncharacterized protein n=1 Tax=Nezara viridula TaxID=85310 RepID=A0A9P0HDW1_NEZVI|nr:unnamed protein product [Nezara viridula]
MSRKRKRRCPRRRWLDDLRGSGKDWNNWMETASTWSGSMEPNCSSQSSPRTVLPAK